eukprot:753290-Hanusia_phi.AAC.1
MNNPVLVSLLLLIPHSSALTPATRPPLDLPFGYNLVDKQRDPEQSISPIPPHLPPQPSPLPPIPPTPPPPLPPLPPPPLPPPPPPHHHHHHLTCTRPTTVGRMILVGNETGVPSATFPSSSHRPAREGAWGRGRRRGEGGGEEGGEGGGRGGEKRGEERKEGREESWLEGMGIRGMKRRDGF